MKLIYMMGKSSSGKDTIYNRLKKENAFGTYVSYTTRPKRDGEIEGVTYNFLSMEEMQEYIRGEKEEKVIEYRTYDTVYGPWIYATIDDEQFKTDKDIITIGTLESYIKIKGHFENSKGVQILPVYVEVPDDLRLKRAIAREKQGKGQYEEARRRFLADAKDFSEEKLKAAGIEKRFENLDLNKCIDEIKEYIGITRSTEDENQRKYDSFDR